MAPSDAPRRDAFNGMSHVRLAISERPHSPAPLNTRRKVGSTKAAVRWVWRSPGCRTYTVWRLQRHPSYLPSTCLLLRLLLLGLLLGLLLLGLLFQLVCCPACFCCLVYCFIIALLLALRALSAVVAALFVAAALSVAVAAAAWSAVVVGGAALSVVVAAAFLQHRSWWQATWW